MVVASGRGGAVRSDVNMEAAGIEPASANPLLSGLHAYPII